ncbi:MAG TPA: hypothetical protein DC042_09390 [Bacteroidales bacterium]|nr:hypothetical protein [Bacteroidales bacterium]
MKRRLLYLSSSFFRLSPFAFVLVMTSCLSLRKSSESDKPLNLYNPGKSVIHPQFTVYHTSANESMLFFKVLASEVIFNQANPSVRDQARLKVYYTLYSSFSKKEVAARDTQSFVINRESVSDAIIASMKVPTEKGKTYLLDVTLEDEIRQYGARDFVWVDRFSEEPRQNWLVLNQPGNHVAFESFYYPGESFRIIREDPPSEKIFISVYSPRNILPLPPYSIGDQPDNVPLPDSTIARAYSGQLQYKLGGEGVYVFHFNPDKVRGLCLTQFGDHYPQITLPEDMLPPLQYISTREEYQKMIVVPDHKKAVDDYWINAGKTYANARDLIRVFYNRVVFANLYFPSSKQGWKTDRGMVYVIFGPPGRVTRTETREIWVYEGSQSEMDVQFEFNLTEDHWWGYDFVLKRSEDYRGLWSNAVNSWRKGKIFSL